MKFDIIIVLRANHLLFEFFGIFVVQEVSTDLWDWRFIDELISQLRDSEVWVHIILMFSRLQEGINSDFKCLIKYLWNHSLEEKTGHV